MGARTISEGRRIIIFITKSIIQKFFCLLFFQEKYGAAFFQESAYSFYCADSVISTGPLPGTMFKRTYLLPLSSL